MEEGPTLKLIMEKGPLEGQTLEFKPGSLVRIGRLVRGNTIAVKDAGVSSKHLTIEFKSGKWVLTDLDSSNGTILNDSNLIPTNPSDLCSDDTIKIGEFTSIKVRIELGERSRVRRNPRRRAKDGEVVDDTVVAVSENRRRRGGAKANLASVGENSELGLGLGFGVGGEVGENGLARNQNQTGRGRRARVSKNEPQESSRDVGEVESMNNAGSIEPKQGSKVGSGKTQIGLGFEIGGELGENGVLKKNQNQSGRPRRGRVLKMEPQEDANNMGPVEPKQGRQVNTRRTRSSKKEENLISDSMLEKISEKSGLDGNDCRESESLAPVEDVGGRRTRGGARRKNNLEDEPLESVQNVVLEQETVEGLSLLPEGCKELESVTGVEDVEGKRMQEGTRTGSLEDEPLETVENVALKQEIVEGFSLQPEGCEEAESAAGVEESLSNRQSEAFQNDAREENEVVEDLTLRPEGEEGLPSVSGVKESGVVVGDEPDLEKMTLGEWFDYLEVNLPKQIHDATEEMISNMRHRAEQVHEFILQQKNEKDKGKLPMG